MSNNTQHFVPIECLICAEPCEALTVFQCGHYVCYICGLHIHAINHSACPVCRESNNFVIITRSLPDEESTGEQFSSTCIQAMQAQCEFDDYLKCYIHGSELAKEIAKMYEFVCPISKCWRTGGRQEPFYEINMLKEHLKIDHGLEYCNVCLQHRSVFLCEQQVYSKEYLQMHMEGNCPEDSSSFLGHPSCKFCHKSRFYDEDYLLNHMKHDHFTCDVCNRSEFRFTYYKDRTKLLQHFEREHKLCDHPTCASLDPMLRVFASDLELALHKQRTHGVKSRLNLFTGDSNTTSSGVNGNNNNNNNSPVAATPATSSNANVIRIIFDHVSRVETVEIMPIRGFANGGKGGGGGGKHSRRNKENNSNHTKTVNKNISGLPIHFRTPGVLDLLMHKESDNEKEGKLIDNKIHPRAFGVSETTEAFNSKNNVPTNEAELKAALDSILTRELNKLNQLSDFRAATADFMQGKMLATKYYNCLRAEFFPSENIFNKVFPLLVATVPLPERRDALIQIEKMRNSPEVQRAYRLQEEESKKRAEDAKWKAQHDIAVKLQQISKKRGNNNNNNNNNNKNKNGGRNVWLEKGGAGIINKQKGDEHSKDSENNNNNNNNNNNRGGGVRINNNNNNNNARPSSVALTSTSSWGASHQHPPTQQQHAQIQIIQTQTQQTPLPRDPLVFTTTAFHEDPENFPALPSSNPRRALGLPKTKKNQRINVWQRK